MMEFIKIHQQLKDYALSDKLTLSNFIEDFVPQEESEAASQYTGHKEHDLPDTVFYPLLTQLSNFLSTLYDPRHLF